jgi:hypothetical protein
MAPAAGAVQIYQIFELMAFSGGFGLVQEAGSRTESA